MSSSFPADHYGKLIGVTYFIGGLANFLQYGFFSWAEAIGSFFPVGVDLCNQAIWPMYVIMRVHYA